MFSGLFIAFGVRCFGVSRFRAELINIAPGDRKMGRGYDWVLTYLVPLEFVAMFGWWIYQAVAVVDPLGWWHPLRTYSLGTCLLQWGIALALLVGFNRKIAALSLR